MLRLTASLRVIVQRFAFVLFAGAAVGLTAMSRLDNPTLADLRSHAVDAMAPVVDVLSRPTAAVQNGIDRIDHFIAVYEENQRLREQNERLLHWQQVARQLEHENGRFRGLLDTVAEPRSVFVSARVIGQAGGAFVRTALINAGEQNGVEVGQAVVATEGMVGRIVETGNRSARILLLTDLNSRVPVVLESSRDPVVLAGDNTDLLKLTFIATDTEIVAGDRLVTSGQGGMMPPGLPVGVVTGLRDGVWRAQPLVDPRRLEYVRVLDYTLPGMLPETREAGAVGQLW